MSTELFRRIAEKLASHDRFFQQRRNAAGELGHSTFQKVTAALRMLAYGIPADLVDNHLALKRWPIRRLGFGMLFWNAWIFE